MHFIYKWRKKCRFLTWGLQGLAAFCHEFRDGGGPEEKRSFLKLSLCLSRACLGTMMHFTYKCQKDSFHSPVRSLRENDVFSF
jgi:hypothetical protein